MKSLFFYGTKEDNTNVTEICFNKLLYKKSVVVIPKNDLVRISYFGDPSIGKTKKIMVIQDGRLQDHDDSNYVVVSLIYPLAPKLERIHRSLEFKHGSFSENLPQQKMALAFLTGSESVLEIGGNIGRNTLVIASIVDNYKFVTMESDSSKAMLLTENKHLNNFFFKIENAALSKRKLIQKDMEIKQSEVLEPGYNWVNTIDYSNLTAKYKTNFDTLILNCRNLFFYILMDMPEILNGINLILMENEYTDITQKEYVDSVLKSNHFELLYSEGGGLGPCSSNFFEAWKK
jgi:hypothetical protein